MKPFYSEKIKNVRPMYINILSSISTGLICDIITNPLWVNKYLFNKNNIKKKINEIIL